MNMQPVFILDGPLQGSHYDLVDEPGSLIELKCTAGAFIYKFKTSESDQTILTYVGPSH